MTTSSECQYTSCYCEENVFMQVKEKPNNAYVLFITNEDESTALWYQKSSPHPKTQAVVWDYHVKY